MAVTRKNSSSSRPTGGASKAKSAAAPSASKKAGAKRAAVATKQTSTKKPAPTTQNRAKAKLQEKPESSEDEDEEENEDIIPLDAGESSESENGQDETDSEAEAEEDDDEAILAGFSDAGADSSDEDEEDDRKTGKITASGVVKLPSSRDDAVVQARLDKVRQMRKAQQQGKGKTSAAVAAESATKPIVLYFGRVPKSMPEEALRAYLTQFGTVKRLRLARNRKTGATKHYAFVEFEDEEVGKIVCETMHNYLLDGRLLQVHVVPKEKQHPSLWIGANRKFRKVPADKRFTAMYEKPRSDEQKRQAEAKLLKRQTKRRKRIADQGIEYTFEGY